MRSTPRQDPMGPSLVPFLEAASSPLSRDDATVAPERFVSLYLDAHPGPHSGTESFESQNPELDGKRKKKKKKKEKKKKNKFWPCVFVNMNVQFVGSPARFKEARPLYSKFFDFVPRLSCRANKGAGERGRVGKGA